jgi:hypothetical protein
MAWLDTQPTVQVLGIELPACHRVPPDAELYQGDDDGKCRLILAGRGRCRAARTRRWGLCAGHAGAGDPAAASVLGHAGKARIRQRRQLLGIGATRVANPRQIARIQALDRAHELAQALVTAPLDDPELTTLERQRAVLAALDATFPLQTMTVELELPASVDDVPAMGWEAMQSVAARLLDDGEPAGPSLAPALKR